MSVYEGLIKLTEYEVSKDPALRNDWQDPQTLYCSDPAINKFAGEFECNFYFLKRSNE
jgi:hypothetical protein